VEKGGAVRLASPVSRDLVTRKLPGGSLSTDQACQAQNGREDSPAVVRIPPLLIVIGGGGAFGSNERAA
jgi:hypothetical protein